jgi:hypothetical protein
VLLSSKLCGIGDSSTHSTRHLSIDIVHHRSSIGRCWLVVAAQSRQSATLFLQSSELGLPHPFSRRRVCPPTLLSEGKGTLACGRGIGGVPIPTRGHTLWCSLNISTLCVADFKFVIRNRQCRIIVVFGFRFVTNETSTEYFHYFCPKEDCEVGAQEQGVCFQPGLLIFLMFYYRRSVVGCQLLGVDFIVGCVYQYE